ncbi:MULTISPECIES: hypothetical protein [Paenibacillus]|uniref:hypothetical protein n=1 Tax=Paenibacillus TaxID=44249 RepID=UPI000A7F882F|nr:MULTISPECIES: hypothetical protein [Paenibacillus]
MKQVSANPIYEQIVRDYRQQGEIMRGSNRGSAQPIMAKSPWWLCGNIGFIIQE